MKLYPEKNELRVGWADILRSIAPQSWLHPANSHRNDRTRNEELRVETDKNGKLSAQAK